MSAIYGIINKDGKPVDPGMVQKMKQAMQHRSKDGSKELICDNAAFGFCHLVVYPNQEHEQLPIQDGDLVFTANAHLHNRDELINKLGFDKLQYSKTPDSYLVLAAYKKWGQECVHHLDGEYVYAIWNRESQELFVSKDKVGNKCLYYYDATEYLIFSSEIGSITSVKKTENFFDEEIIVNAFLHEGNHECTYNKEIKTLLGATNLSVKRNEIKLYKYWYLQAHGKYNFSKPESWAECIRELFIRSIEERINTTQPIGIKLSGGLDSSSIACVLAKVLVNKNLPLYSYSSAPPNDFPTNKNDESHYRKMVLDLHPNILNNEVHAKGTNPFLNLDKAFDIDENIPWIFHYMDLAIMEAAASDKVKIMYSGLGGDHSVSSQGPTLIPQLINSGRIITVIKLLRELAKSKGLQFSKVFFHECLSKTSVAKFIFSLYRWHESSLFNRGFLNNYPILKAPPYRPISHRVNVGLTGKFIQVLEPRHECYGMSSANPFFDVQLLELMEDVPKELYLKHGFKRYIFREAMKGILPEGIRLRHSKSPYVVNGLQLVIENMRFAEEHLLKENCFLDKYFNGKELAHLIDTFSTVAYTDNFKAKLARFSNVIYIAACINHLARNKYFFN